ncbi:MAG: DNA-3-methyladenine glycosylase family protein [Nocardioidaceae bacterium]
MAMSNDTVTAEGFDHGERRSLERSVTLSTTTPFDGTGVLGFLADRVVAGIEACDEHSYSRSMRAPHGPAFVVMTPGDGGVRCRVSLADERDWDDVIARCRRVFDLDADPRAIDGHLGRDTLLAQSVRTLPGIRVPGHVDGFEVAVRAVVGQQISVAGARTVLGRLVLDYGEPVKGRGRLTHLFPRPHVVASIDPEDLPMPRARGRALVGLGAAVSSGEVLLEHGVDLPTTRSDLLELPGIGPWTADYIALRSLGDRDVFLETDLGVKHGLTRLGVRGDARQAAQRWKPWRSYAMMHVWGASTARDHAPEQR